MRFSDLKHVSSYHGCVDVGGNMVGPSLRQCVVCCVTSVCAGHSVRGDVVQRVCSNLKSPSSAFAVVREHVHWGFGEPDTPEEQNGFSTMFMSCRGEGLFDTYRGSKPTMSYSSPMTSWNASPKEDTRRTPEPPGPPVMIGT